MVGNAEELFHQLNCKKAPLCTYIGFSTSAEFQAEVAIMTWDNLGEISGRLFMTHTTSSAGKMAMKTRGRSWLHLVL